MPGRVPAPDELPVQVSSLSPSFPYISLSAPLLSLVLLVFVPLFDQPTNYFCHTVIRSDVVLHLWQQIAGLRFIAIVFVLVASVGTIKRTACALYTMLIMITTRI